MTLNSGTLNTNGQTVNTQFFWSVTNVARTLNMGASVFNISGLQDAWMALSPGLTINAGISVINLTSPNAEFHGDNNLVHSYYDLNFSGATSGHIFGTNNFHEVDFSQKGYVVSSNTFNTLSFHKGGELQSGNVFNNLNFTQGFTYELGGNAIQTINGTLNASGNCGAYITIVSNTPGNPATISHPAGTVMVSYVILKDIHATGGAFFTADNATDLGNNTGWTFTNSGVQDLYWIGNGGNWDDGNHWSHSSGGTPSGCAPGPLDNVFFDSNSFSLPGQAVLINTISAYCRNMDWTGASNTPAFGFSSFSNILNIYGSLNFIPAMTTDLTGEMHFKANSPGQTINLSGASPANKVSFDGIGGAWSLQDPFLCDSSVVLNSGIVTTNNQPFRATDFSSRTTFTRALNMGASSFTLTGPNAWWIQNTGIVINAGSSVINCTAPGAVFIGNTTGMINYNDLNFISPVEGYISSESNFHDVDFSGKGIIRNSCTFHNVIFHKDGEIESGNVFDHLTFNAGYTYRLWKGFTQTITGTFSASGTCGALITITSNIADSVARISHPPGTINISYAVLKDIHTAGGATFIASNCVDLGNNTGWTFNSSGTQNLYWIGNGGNWSNGSHWSLTSGGPPSGCSPTPSSNVFFDVNSFTSAAQTVTIDVTTAYCRNMDWSGVTNNPAFGFSSVSSFLKIYGSLTFVPAMTMGFGGKVNFEANSPGQMITMAGAVFANEAEFNGSGGEWTMMDAFGAYNIWLNNGTLNTNGQTVTASSFWSVLNTTRVLNMGSSVFNLSGVLAWWVDNSGITVNSGTSVINCSFDNAQIMVNSTAVDTYYDVNFTALSQGSIVGSANFHDVVFSGKGNILAPCSFHNATFLGDGEIASDNIYNDLNFTAGHSYLLRQNHTQTVNGSFNASGTCSALLSINTGFSGTASTISHPPGAVNIAYAVLKNIHTAGGASFTAINSVDLGNNTGWTFTSTGSPDLYWIGNSGNWDDGNHWSLTSGGTPAGCAPTQLNNVFFDANSFSLPGQTVLINIATASCRNMDWTGAGNTPALGDNLSFNMLKIHGSLKLIPAMAFDLTGKVDFAATSTAHTITMAGHTFLNNAEFTGAGGEWTLLDAFGALNIWLNNGSLHTNGQSVTANSLWSVTGTTRLLDMGSSVFNMSGITPWRVEDLNLTVNCGTSVINCTNSLATFQGNSLAIDTYYDLNFTGGFENHLRGTNNFHNVSFAGKGFIYEQDTFNDVTFLGDGHIESTNDFHNLNFTAGHSYMLWAGSTQTISNRWLIQGTCSVYIILESNSAGSFASVSVPADSIFGHNIHISDIHCTGGATFMAYNSVDLGGNSGWIFATLQPLFNSGPISGPTIVCSGSTGISYQVAPVQGAIFYQWSVPPGVTIFSGQGTTQITVNFGSVTSGNITVQSYNGCNYGANSSAAVNVQPPVTASVSLAASPSASICPGTAVIFTATVTNSGSAAINYNFKLNGIVVQSGNPDNYSTTTLSGGDIVTCDIELTGNGCFNSNTASSNPVIIDILPQLTPAVTVTAIPSTTVCPATPVTFTAVASNAGTGTVMYDFKVNGASVQNSAANLYTATCSDNDVISCNISITGGTCYTSTTAVSNDITIDTDPGIVPVNVYAGNNVTITAGQTVQLQGSGDTGIYLWTPSSGLSATNILNPLASPAVTTTYTLSITSMGGCTGSDEVEVNVLPSTAVDCKPMTAITPNGDGMNDRWVVTNADCPAAIRVTVFNRYGSPVFTSLNYQNDWQGTYKGSPLPDATYYFVIEYRLRNGNKISTRGNLTILR
jgi:gliding motility-associated-like protein